MLRALAPFAFALIACGPVRPHPDVAPPRDVPIAPDAAAWNDCIPGQTRCTDNVYQVCVAAGELTRVQDTDCAASGEACEATLGGCVACHPGSTGCTDDRSQTTVCRADGSGYDPADSCDLGNGVACSNGRCQPLCTATEIVGTNIGCEYYAVDLDNAVLGAGMSAASQQYAVVVSNPDPVLTARVHVEWNTAAPGETPHTSTVASAVIPPMDLEVFPLPAREVDCSVPGTFNTGTGTCLSSQAYHIVSSIPVIAFQFNPLTNVDVFSNDASLLIPTNSLRGQYMAMGWPQTIASAPPEVVLDPFSPADLRGFVTIVGTVAGTHVHVVPRADVLPGGPIVFRSAAGAPIDVVLGPFDVLNLETDGFLADLTGTTVDADEPVAVFSGSECSDAPDWRSLGERQCCCDHLEAQQFPRDTIGTRYVAVHTPRRTPAVIAAGAAVALADDEPEFFRVLATGTATTHVVTSLPTNIDDPTSAPFAFDLEAGDVRELRAYTSFTITADGPVSVANFMSSQLNTGIPLSYPGGDPSFIPIPPFEQWRASYVFLTPDKYAFDFVSIVAPASAAVMLDGQPVPTADCTVERGDGCVATLTHACPASDYSVYQCQLSFPIVDNINPYPNNVHDGRQNDGVHVVSSDQPVGVIVSGFDLRVSYGYPAGTQLRPLL